MGYRASRALVDSAVSGVCALRPFLLPPRLSALKPSSLTRRRLAMGPCLPQLSDRGAHARASSACTHRLRVRVSMARISRKLGHVRQIARRKASRRNLASRPPPGPLLERRGSPVRTERVDEQSVPRTPVLLRTARRRSHSHTRSRPPGPRCDRVCGALSYPSWPSPVHL